jgi:hypothetical protein
MSLPTSKTLGLASGRVQSPISSGSPRCELEVAVPLLCYWITDGHLGRHPTILEYPSYRYPTGRKD